MARQDTFDLITQALFSIEKRNELSEGDLKILERLRDVYTLWLDKPTLKDTDIRDYIMVNYDSTKSAAYTDIALLKTVLGNVPVANKEFYRYKANYILDQAHAAAVAGNDRKAKVLAKIAEGIAYNNRTNEDDGEKLPFDQIIPKDLSFSIDPSVAGVKPVKGIRETAEKLFKKYDGEIELDISNYTDFDEQENLPE